MNEKIKELAQQAGIWRQHYDVGLESSVNLELFAELIVAKCSDIAYTMGEDKIKVNNPYNGIEVAYAIDEYFGRVE